MLKKSAIVLSALLCATPCFAQTDLKQTTDALSGIITQTTEQMAGTLQQALPEIAGKMEDLMTSMMKSVAPFVLSVEENKKLPAATPEMIEDVKEAIGYKYTQNTFSSIDDKFNSFTLQGSYVEGSSKLQYTISRFLATTIATDNMFKKDTADNKQNGINIVSNQQISTLSGEQINRKDMQLSETNGLSTLVYDNPDKQDMFVVANVGAYLALEVQSTGPRYKELLLEFLGTINQDELKRATKDDGRSLDDIQKELREKAEDPAILKNVFEKFQTLNGAP